MRLEHSGIAVRRALVASVVAASVVLAGCEMLGLGGDDDDGKKNDSCKSNCVGDGFVVTGSGESIVVEFPGAAAGHEYVLAPFAIGNAQTNPGSSGQKAALKITGAAALTGSGSGFDKSRSERNGADRRVISWQEYDHDMRTVYNRFSPERGLDDDPELLSLVRAIDAVDSVISSDGVEISPAGVAELRQVGLEEILRRGEARVRDGDVRSRRLVERSDGQVTLQTTNADCPTDFISVPETADLTSVVDIGVAKAVNGDDFCIIYAEQSTPVSEPDEARLTASMKEIMRVYKDVMYGDKMTANQRDGYRFRPIVVVVDFSNADLWPKEIQLSGAFLSDVTTTVKRPMIYMAADQSKGGGPSDPVLARRRFHSTMAHEIHHAVVDYYRSRGAAQKPETLAVDEGMALFVQDLFGYGDVDFVGFTKAWILTFIDGTASFLSGSGDDEKILRGGAHSLIHYLVSQKGGVTFTNGKPSGGGGFATIAGLVKDTNRTGAQSLAAAFSTDWSASVAGFLGAVVLDGSAVPGVVPKYSNQALFTDVTDLEGSTGKTFGMRFNGFAGMPERISAYVVSTDASLASGDRELDLYQSVPVRHVVKNPSVKLTVNFPQDGNAVSVVRIK